MSQGSWLNSKYLPYIILALTSLTYSKIFYFLIDDPEGPNLLIVVLLAAILYGFAWLLSFRLPITNPYKLLIVIALQGVVTLALFFGLR